METPDDFSEMTEESMDNDNVDETPTLDPDVVENTDYAADDSEVESDLDDMSKPDKKNVNTLAVGDNGVEKITIVKRGKKKTDEKKKINFAKLNINELTNMTISGLASLAREFNIEDTGRMKKQDLIFAVLQAQTEKHGLIFASGVLEILQDGYGFLRSPSYNYLPGPDVPNL